MSEEIINNDYQEEQESAVDIITEMRANTVPKDKYERLQAEHGKLLKALAKGDTIEVEAPNKPDVDELRLSLYTENVQMLSDVQIAEKTLQLRQAVMEAGGQDPFVPFGKQTGPEDSDFATADRVASVLQDCVDYANGDNAIFLAELQRRTMDVNPIASRAANRRR